MVAARDHSCTRHGVLELALASLTPNSWPPSNLIAMALVAGQVRSNMRYAALGVVLIGAITLGGCTEGVLDPKGPIAFAERQILFNATGIMLAIVIPVVLATLGVAFWFRASNGWAEYQPDFKYSGRIEMLVWSIPLMTVLLVGAVAWVGSYDLDPPKPIVFHGKPVRVQVVSLD
jgi:heme/copper-type cytochrome/quinol oxidase subunit 2